MSELSELAAALEHLTYRLRRLGISSPIIVLKSFDDGARLTSAIQGEATVSGHPLRSTRAGFEECEIAGIKIQYPLPSRDYKIANWQPESEGQP